MNAVLAGRGAFVVSTARVVVIVAASSWLVQMPVQAQQSGSGQEAVELLSASAQCPIKPRANDQYVCQFTGNTKTFRYNCAVTESVHEADRPIGSVRRFQDNTVLNYADMKSIEVCRPKPTPSMCYLGSEVFIHDTQGVIHAIIVCDDETADNVKSAMDVLIRLNK